MPQKESNDDVSNYSHKGHIQGLGRSNAGMSAHKNTLNNLVQQYKVLNEKHIKKLDDYFNSPNAIRTRKDYVSVAKKLGIPMKKIVEYVELRMGQRISILEDFYSNANTALKTIQLDNEYAMIKYKMLDKYFREKNMMDDNCMFNHRNAKSD